MPATPPYTLASTKAIIRSSRISLPAAPAASGLSRIARIPAERRVDDEESEGQPENKDDELKVVVEVLARQVDAEERGNGDGGDAGVPVGDRRVGDPVDEGDSQP